MRVLQIGKFYPPYHGGMESVLEALSIGLKSRGHKITVLCANEKYQTERSEIGGVNVIRLASLGVLFSQPLMPGFLFELKRLIKNTDIIHIHTPNPWAEFICLFIDKPIVITYHADVVRQKKLLLLYSFIRNFLLSKAFKIIVASEKLKKSSVALKEFQNKIAVIPFGLPLKQFEATEEIISQAQKISQRIGDYYLFVGRLVEYKGLPVLIRAWKNKRERLVIIGIGPQEEALKQLVETLGLKDRIIFMGSIESQVELSAYFYSAKSIVLPSITKAEAFGMVLIEALGWGKPIISTNLDTGISEVNDDGKTGLVIPPNDDIALSNAIDKISSEESLAKAFGKNGRKKFLEKYEVNAMCGDYEKIYESFRP